MSGSSVGLSEADYERLGDLAREARARRKKHGEREVDAETCAEWRARYNAGETVLGDILPSVEYGRNAVNNHVHGHCHHGGGAR